MSGLLIDNPGVTAMLPLLMLAVGGLAVMLVDAFTEDRAGLAVLTTILFIAAGGLSFGLWVNGPEPAAVPELVTRYLAVDRMALFFDLVICLGGALTAMLAGGYLREHHQDRGEFYVLLIYSAFGAVVLARAADLLTIFLGLETMSLGVYCMVAFRRTSPRSAEGAVKYFLLGSFAAAILLFGSALLYGATGHTDLDGIRAGIASGNADPRLVLIGVLMVIVGLAFKVSAVPFHMWTPDAYEGALTPATSFMAVAVKAAAFAVTIRVLAVGFSDPALSNGATGWPPVLAAIAAATMIVGNAAAIVQSSVKRMLAYSSIAHAGYTLIGVVASYEVGSEALSAVLYYMPAYAVSKTLAFGALILAGSEGKEAVSYEDLAGLGRRHPLVAIPFVIGLLSLMGFPPTAGFFGKYYVFNAGLQAGTGLVWLVMIGVLTSAVAAFYYLKVIVYLYMREPAPGAPVAVPMKSGFVTTALLVSTFLVLALGIDPAGYLDMALAAAGVGAG
ncbi:MAG TPA: NADH-quinone oxidoreductase subunit N [Polyangiaceae bacterium LLY-WYZ-14_1]|jgi:NADH-quinone oxidoreductase subunit N|nr:NADH-quinone oxidoreductase subunit N [Polyangiaceae bacterium LLY-WYZ-14_1]